MLLAAYHGYALTDFGADLFMNMECWEIDPSDMHTAYTSFADMLYILRYGTQANGMSRFVNLDVSHTHYAASYASTSPTAYLLAHVLRPQTICVLKCVGSFNAQVNANAARFFEDALKAYQHLIQLDCSENEFGNNIFNALNVWGGENKRFAPYRLEYRRNNLGKPQEGAGVRPQRLHMGGHAIKPAVNFFNNLINVYKLSEGQAFKRLVYLNLSGNSLRFEDVPSLRLLSEQVPSIRLLDLSYNRFNLVDTTQENPLSTNQLTDLVAMFKVELGKDERPMGKGLVYLNLAGNEIHITKIKETIDYFYANRDTPYPVIEYTLFGRDQADGTPQTKVDGNLKSIDRWAKFLITVNYKMPFEGHEDYRVFDDKDEKDQHFIKSHIASIYENYPTFAAKQTLQLVRTRSFDPLKMGQWGLPEVSQEGRRAAQRAIRKFRYETGLRAGMESESSIKRLAVVLQARSEYKACHTRCADDKKESLVLHLPASVQDYLVLREAIEVMTSAHLGITLPQVVQQDGHITLTEPRVTEGVRGERASLIEKAKRWLQPEQLLNRVARRLYGDLVEDIVTPKTQERVKGAMRQAVPAHTRNTPKPQGDQREQARSCEKATTQYAWGEHKR